MLPGDEGKSGKVYNDRVSEQGVMTVMQSRGSLSNTFSLVVRPDKASMQTAEKLRRQLEEQGIGEDAVQPDYVIVVGGDGTFLYAIHQYMETLSRHAFIGVHTGTLGFFMDYMDTELEDFVSDLSEGRLEMEPHALMEARTGGKTLYAVNEVRIENPVRTQNITVYLNGEKFEDFRGSGLCLCTQLGSSAYNRSLGGAVLQKGLGAFEMAEIAGIHHSRFRSLGVPFVMSDTTAVRFSSEDFSGAVLGVDSDVLDMKDMQTVEVARSESKILHIARGKKITDFRRLERLF